MTITAPKISTFADQVTNLVGRFLFREKFVGVDADIATQGLVDLIDAIGSGVYEEGKRLYPEVLVTTDLQSSLKGVSAKVVRAGSLPLERENFSEALKRTASFAENGWVVFIELANDLLATGVVTAQHSILSPPLFEHCIGAFASEPSAPMFWIRGISRTVELRGALGTHEFVSMHFGPAADGGKKELETLASHLASDANAREFLARVFERMTQRAHGALIAVIECESMDPREEFDGVFLQEPMPLLELVARADDEPQSAWELHTHLGLISGMVEQDGFTLMDTAGNVIGYRVFVEKQTKETGNGKPKGRRGGRYRAFKTMSENPHSRCVFYQSHDGPTAIWERTND